LHQELANLNRGQEDNFGQHTRLADVSLGEIHEILKLANARTLGASQSGGLSMYNVRRFIQQGTELGATPGSHAQVVYRPG